MKKLIIYLVIVAAVLVALIVAPSLIGDKGYVLIALGNLTIETSVVALGIMVFLGLVAWFIFSTAATRLWRLTKGSHHWFGSWSKRKQQKAFYRSIQALAEGDWQGALKAAEQAESGNFEGVNYLIAAQAAQAQHLDDKGKRMLQRAAEHTPSKLAATLTLARQALVNNAPSEALKHLDTLDEKQANRPQAIAVKVEALAANNQWQQLQDSLPRWKKALGDNYANWSKLVAQGQLAEIASKQGAIQLKTFWQELPRKQRNDQGYQAAYVEQLLAQGMHNDAQDLLNTWQKRGPVAVLLPLYRKLRLPNPASSIKQLEGWIKEDDKNAELYSTLGHLAYHCGDKTLAQKALHKAITLNPNQTDLLLLSGICEDENDTDKALSFYKQGMALSK
jgi:HemY protein